MSLLEAYNSLLTEAVAPSIIMKTLQKKKRVVISYDADSNDPMGKGDRVIEPCALGFTYRNNAAIRAYQLNGATETYTPEWKIFLLKNILKWQPIEETFEPESRYNYNGDKTFKKTLYRVV